MVADPTALPDCVASHDGLARVMRSDRARERLLATFAPVSVLMLLAV